jgi:hypothetical protein
VSPSTRPIAQSLWKGASRFDKLTAIGFALSLLSCGGGESGRMEMTIARPRQAQPGTTLQILFAERDRVPCTSYQASTDGCYLTAGFSVNFLEPVIGPDRRQHRAYRDGFNVPSGETRSFGIDGIAVGRPYSVIVELIAPNGNLSYRGCGETIGAVGEGDNAAVSVVLSAWSGTACQAAVGD